MISMYRRLLKNERNWILHRAELTDERIRMREHARILSEHVMLLEQDEHLEWRVRHPDATDAERGVNDGPARELTAEEKEKLMALVAAQAVVTPSQSIVAERHEPAAKPQSHPGDGLRKFAVTVFGRRANERIFESVVADLQFERRLALEDGRMWEARFAVLRGYLAFWRAAAQHVGLAALVKKVSEIRAAVGL